MVDNCFTVAAFCICAAIFAVLLKQYCREQSLMISLCACVAVIGASSAVLAPLISDIRGIFTDAGISSSYISLIFKATAICFITQITCDICRDSGENAIASAAELWGRGTITVMSLPLITTLVEIITDFL